MPIADITREETATRAGLLRVRSYDVELDLTGGDETFRSVSVIRFDCTEAGAASYSPPVMAPPSGIFRPTWTHRQAGR
jgi:aminopeptidase N